MYSLYRILILICFVVSLDAQVFEEVALAQGINHSYKEDNYMGGGCVFFDFDNDGWEDLYIVGGKSMDQLYRNNGDGSFYLQDKDWIHVTKEYYTTGVVAGDLNNDGLRDLFVTSWKNGNNFGDNEKNLLFMNEGNGVFRDTGMEAGITETSFSMGAAMLDYDQDGLLDIYVINYMEEQKVKNDPDGQIIFNHTCFPNFLYRNNGDGTFNEIADELGIGDMGCALAVMPTDYDQDSDMDLYVANDFGGYILPSSMYANNFPEESFENVSQASRLDARIFAMGIACGDLDRDSDMDFYLTNLGKNLLLINDGSGQFSDGTSLAGVQNTYTPDENGDSHFSTSWGTAFLDVNNDGWLDIFVANGNIPAHPSIITGANDPNKLYLNNGDLSFDDVSVEAGIDDPRRGRGMAYCDYDQDGDLDLMVIVQGSPADNTIRSKLYENQLNPKDQVDQNWIQLELEGTSVNKNAIGAQVIITAGGEKFIQEVHGQGSHCSQHSLVLHFGLGTYQSVDSIEINWSKYLKQEITDLAINQRHHIIEDAYEKETIEEEMEQDTISTAQELIIYPNPVEDRLFLDHLPDDSTISIISLAGSYIYSYQHRINSTYIDVSALPTGLYLAVVAHEDYHYYKKFFKN